jgi:hypothetical protein
LFIPELGSPKFQVIFEIPVVSAIKNSTGPGTQFSVKIIEL